MKVFTPLLILSALFLGCNNVQTQSAADSTTAITKPEEAAKAITSSDIGGLNDTLLITLHELKYNFSSIDFSSQWVFDAYQDEYHYHNPERNDTYVAANMNITSDSKDPSLNALCVFKWDKKGEILNLGTMEYRFRTWQDYGAYLGNYPDNGNDFAYTATIDFTAGLELADSLINSTLIVAMAKQPSFVRSYSRFREPTYSYSDSTMHTDEMTMKLFFQDYRVIKVFNRVKA